MSVEVLSFVWLPTTGDECIYYGNLALRNGAKKWSKTTFVQETPLRKSVSKGLNYKVIQNGANSACGQYIIQICRSWGIRTVNIIRDRPNVSELKTYLTNLGATHVLTEEELRTTDIFKSGQINKPKLALNCVGGKNALECLRHLENGSPMVTYGGMSREPLSIPTSSLIFKDLQFKGFWMTRWSLKNATSVDRFEMFSELISMMTSNELRGPSYELVDFQNYKEALINTLTVKGMTGKKYVLKFE